MSLHIIVDFTRTSPILATSPAESQLKPCMERLLRRDAKHLFHLLKSSLYVLKCQSIHCSSGSIFVQRVWRTVPKQKRTFLASLRPSAQDWEDHKKRKPKPCQKAVGFLFVAVVSPHQKNLPCTTHKLRLHFSSAKRKSHSTCCACLQFLANRTILSAYASMENHGTFLRWTEKSHVHTLPLAPTVHSVTSENNYIDSAIP